MSAELWILVATAVLAVVAVLAAAVAVRAVRRFDAAPAAPALDPSDGLTSPDAASPASDVVRVDPDAGPAALAPRIIEGRVIVPPTEQQVVATALGRPRVRLSILAHGVAHALRPESRDRIGGLMRREYRRRRRERLQAGRRAARSTRPTPASAQWLGELPDEGNRP